MSSSGSNAAMLAAFKEAFISRPQGQVAQKGGQYRRPTNQVRLDQDLTKDNLSLSLVATPAKVQDSREIVTQDGTIYLIDSILGKGGLGIVYRARSSSDGQIVALKLPSIAGDPVCHEFLERESQILSRLNHPHIVDVYKTGKTIEGEPYIAMELIEGQTLAQLIKTEAALSRERAVNICLQIADAIQHAHEAGVIHRDLKPANILIASIAGMDWVYVLDFGISDLEGQACQDTDKTTSGSLCYLAPEQVCQHTYTKRSDIYQLSLILFECLTGHLPFELSFAGAIMYRLGGPLLPNDSELTPVLIPWNLRFVLEKGLARDPANRYSSMLNFARDLRQILSRWSKAA